MSAIDRTGATRTSPEIVDRYGPNNISALFASNSISNNRHTITRFVIPYSVDTMRHFLRDSPAA